MVVKQEIRDLKGIAGIYQKRGRLKLAADVLSTVLDLETHAYGPESIELATTKCELAEILCELKQYQKARALMLESARIWQKHRPSAEGQAIQFTRALEFLQNHPADMFGNKNSGESEAA